MPASRRGRTYHLLGPDPLEIEPSAGTLVVNAGGTGVFRVHYDDDLLAAIVSVIHDLDPLERYTLVADTWACTLSGRAGLGSFFELASRLACESDPFVWSVVTGALSLVDYAVTKVDRSAYCGAISLLLGAEMERIGWSRRADDPSQAPRLRSVLVAALGALGRDEAIVGECRRRFAALGEGEHLDPDLAGAILRVVASTAGYEEYQQLLDHYRKPADPLEERRYLDALGQVTDPDLVSETLRLTLSEIRSQDAPYLVRALLANRLAGETTWAFLVEHFEEMNERYPANSIARMLSGVTRLVQLGPDGSPEVAERVQEFLGHRPFAGMQQPIDQHLERLEVNLAFVTSARGVVGDLLPSLRATR